MTEILIQASTIRFKICLTLIHPTQINRTKYFVFSLLKLETSAKGLVSMHTFREIDTVQLKKDDEKHHYKLIDNNESIQYMLEIFRRLLL